MMMMTSPIEFLDVRNSSYAPFVCYTYSMISTGTILRGENPLDFTYPLFLLNILVIILTTRATAILLQPLRMPRYLSDLIGGILLGPTGMGQIPSFTRLVFPLRSVVVLETLGYLGLIYFLFIVAIDLDLSAVRRNKGRSAMFAAVCIVVPFAVGLLSGFVLCPGLQNGPFRQGGFIAFLGVVFSVTAFSILARTLADLKVLHTDMGATVLSSAMIVDACAWGLLAVAIILADNSGHILAMVWTMLSGAAFVGGVIVVVRPAVGWVAARAAEAEEVGDLHAGGMLVGVLVAAIVADMIGINAVTGAFLFGMVIPNGPLATALIERVEDFVQGMMLPVFFAVSGLKTNIYSVEDAECAVVLILVVVAAAAAKVAACMLVGHLQKMPPRDGLSIGLLMSTKGMIEMVVLNVGRDKQVLNEPAFTILVFMSITVTVLLNPLLALVVKPAGRRLAPYQRRTVQWAKPDAELRMLVCVHSNRNVQTMISLVEASNPTKRAPILLHALHLIELTGRASAMLIIHNTGNSKASGGLSSRPSAAGPRASSDNILQAFEIYEQHTAGVSVQGLTAVSPYPTMHHDICGVADDKYVALIILPFHKHQTVDGGMEITNPAIRTLNQNVLNAAPCSVGILIDRGLGGAVRFANGQHTAHHVALVFLGGPDDREALAYASRMAEHPGIGLTVLRLVPALPGSPKEERVVTLSPDLGGQEQRLDEECMGEFRKQKAGDESVVYIERAASNGEETVAAIRSMDSIHDLYIVGRGRGEECPLTAGLNDWSECPELGPIGDMLASSDGIVSVLVVRRFVAEAVVPPPAGEAAGPDTQQQGGS